MTDSKPTGVRAFGLVWFGQLMVGTGGQLWKVDGLDRVGAPQIPFTHQRILTSSVSRSIVALMRTTLSIDDDVLEAARSLSEAEGKSLGEMISDLARRGLAPRPQIATEEGFPVFLVSSGAKPITLEIVKKALEEEGKDSNESPGRPYLGWSRT